MYMTVRVFSGIHQRYSHTLVVAEANCELKEFLQWYTTSGISGGGAGQKGGHPKCKRSRNIPITHCSASGECGPNGINIGASTSQIKYSVMLPSAPPPLSDTATTNTTSSTSCTPSQSSKRQPILLKGICQGCRGTSDGAVPSPPFDIAVARAEQRSFRDPTSHFKTAKCIKAVEPSDIHPQLCTAHIQHSTTFK